MHESALQIHHTEYATQGACHILINKPSTTDRSKVKPVRQVANYLTEHGPKTQQEIMDGISNLDTSQSTLSRILNGPEFGQYPLPGAKIFSFKESGPPRNVEALIGGSVLKFVKLQAAYSNAAKNTASAELESRYLTRLRDELLSIEKRLNELERTNEQ